MSLTSSLSLAKENLRQTLAGAESFWAFCQIVLATIPGGDPLTPEQAAAAKKTAALQRIYINGMPRPAGDSYTLEEFAAYHPCAVIFTAEENGYSKEVWSDANIASGALKLRLYAIRPVEDVSGGEPDADAAAAFEDSVGLILDELYTLAVAGQSSLVFNKIDVVHGPFWYDPRETPIIGCRQGVELSISWSGM